MDFTSFGGPTPPPPTAEAWTCSCGKTGNTLNFCQDCGKAKPAAGAPTPVPVPAPAPPTAGISLDLNKGAVLDLTKRNPGLKAVMVGAGWDMAVAGADVDLDISAFMLNSAGKITSGGDVIFYNNMQAPGIKLSGDNRTGSGQGDDETIDVDLSQIPPQYGKIAFCVTIHEAAVRRQTFGMVSNAYIRLCDAANGNKEVCRFSLRDDYSTSTAVIFAELKRNGGEWDFVTVGDGKQGDLNTLAAYYS